MCHVSQQSSGMTRYHEACPATQRTDLSAPSAVTDELKLASTAGAHVPSTEELRRVSRTYIWPDGPYHT